MGAGAKGAVRGGAGERQADDRDQRAGDEPSADEAQRAAGYVGDDFGGLGTI